MGALSDLTRRVSTTSTPTPPQSFDKFRIPSQPDDSLLVAPDIPEVAQPSAPGAPPIKEVLKSAVSTTGNLASLAGKFAISAAREIPRSLARIELEKNRFLTKLGFSDEMAGKLNQAGSFFNEGFFPSIEGDEATPSGVVQQSIFGKEPITPIRPFAETTLKGLGVPSGIAEKPFVSIPFGIFLTALDLFPGTAGKAKLSKIALSRNSDKILKIVDGIADLRKLPTITKTKMVENLVKATTREEVESLITSTVRQSDELTRLARAGVDELAPSPQQIDKKIVEQRFRGDKLDLPENQLLEIEKRLSVLGLSQRTVRTFEEMKNAAQALGIDPNRLLKETTTSRITDAEVIGLRNIISTNSDAIAKAQDEIVRINGRLGQETLSKADTTSLREARIAAEARQGAASAQINTALTKLIKGGTEAGRAVASFRILAEKTLDPFFWQKQAKKTLGGRELTDEMIVAINDLIIKSDRQGLATFISTLRDPDFAEKGIALWKAGLLTSPTTHLANIGGNITMAGLMTASDLVAVPFDILAALFTGERTVTITPRTIAAKVKGLAKGTKQGAKFFKTGVYPDDILAKYDIPRQTNFKNKFWDLYTKGIFRSLGAEDIVFRQAAMSEAMEKQAILMAKNEGLKGNAAKLRIGDLLTEPTNSMIANTIDAAEFATFQGRNVLSDAISGAKARSSKGLRAALEFIAPFTRTPTNIAGRIADFSPIGFVKAFAKIAIPTTRSQKAFIEDISRAVTGTGILAFGAYLARKGIMTGNAPENKKERDQFFAEGKQANSLRIGDKWLSLNRTSPFGNLLSLGAEYEELSGEFEGLSLLKQTGFAGIRGLTEQTFLKGVSGALDVLTTPERSSEKFIQQSAASIVPSVVGRFARTIDPRLRVPANILEAIQAKIPGLSKGLALRRDIFGEPIVPGGGPFILVDPFAAKEAKDDPVIEEAKKVGVTIGLPGETISGIKLNEDEYSTYQKVHGRVLKEVLTQLVKTPQYQDASISDKQTQFKKVISEMRATMNDLVFPALMIKRYQLLPDTNKKLLRDVLLRLSRERQFEKASIEEQGEILRRVFSQ